MEDDAWEHPSLGQAQHETNGVQAAKIRDCSRAGRYNAPVDESVGSVMVLLLQAQQTGDQNTRAMRGPQLFPWRKLTN